MNYPHIQDFFNAMLAEGIAPASLSEIIADDKKHRFHIKGDKPNSKNGVYQLKAEGNFAFGWFMSFKIGLAHKWSSKSNRSFTLEEREEFRKKMAAEKKKKEAELNEDRKAAAQEAEKHWQRAAKTGEHPYLARKQCELNGARIQNKLLVVPIYYNSKISSLQFIDGEGNKNFITNGRIEGAFFPIAKTEDDKSVMVLCEGFATGDSIRKATDLPVICAFNAGNLKPVAQILKKKYPETRFIIAADNDKFTKKPSGEFYNPGITYAQQAAVSIGGAAVVWPDFPQEMDSEKFTDFNDAFIALGKEYVKNRILQAQQPAREAYGGEMLDSGDSGSQSLPATNSEAPPSWVDELPPLEAYSDEVRDLVALYTAKPVEEKANWRDGLRFNDEGKLVAGSLLNARLMLEHDKVLGQLFCYDEFAHEKKVYQCPPWESVEDFRPHVFNETDKVYLTCELEKRGCIQPTSTVGTLLSAIIKKNSRNPAKEYFNGLTWDKTPRLDTWLSYYCGAEFDKSEYLQQVGRKWLTAAAARVFEPGKKFDHMLILEGPQNAGKSLVLKELATIGGTAYFDDTIKITDLGSPATVPKLQGVLIIELAELAGLNRKDMNDLKSEVTITHDRLVRKYENEPTKYPRQFVFAATYNPTASGYLADPTGGRRFWPVKVGKKIDIESLRRDREQLWAEAVHLYREGEKLYLEGKAYELAQEAQEQRSVISPWYPDVEFFTRTRDVIPFKEIWELLDMSDKSKRTRRASDEIAGIMEKLGFEESRIRQGTERPYVWQRKISINDLPLEDGDEIIHD